MAAATSTPSERMIPDRVIYLGVAFVVAVIMIACLQFSLRWIGQPFNGFLMAKNRVVMEVGPANWSGHIADVPRGSQLVAINFQPIQSVDEALAAAREVGRQRTLRYTFRNSGYFLNVTIPVSIFTARDYFGVFAQLFFRSLTFVLMGLIVALLRPELPAARAMLALSLTYGFEPLLRLDELVGFHFREIHAFTRSLAPAAILYFASNFPDPRPWVKSLPYRIAVLALVVIALGFDLILFESAPEEWFIFHQLHSVLVDASLILGALIIASSYRFTRQPFVREKIRIVALGATVGFVFPEFARLIGSLIGSRFPEEAVSAATWVFPATLAYAVVKRNPAETNLFLQRGFAYVTISVLVFLLYSAVVAGFVALSVNLIAARSPWFTLFFSLVIMLLAWPAWNGLRQMIDRLYFRTRFDYAEIIQSVSRDLTRAVEEHEIATLVQQAVDRTFAPTSCNLYVRAAEPGLFRPLDSRGENLQLESSTCVALTAGQWLDASAMALSSAASAPGTALIMPLRFRTELDGVIALGTKWSGIGYGDRDIELLQTLANQAAIALRHVATYRHSSELLVSLEARVSERTRELQSTQLELEQSIRKLRELDRFKTQFFADASHELRTPLTLVLGPLEEARRSSEVPASTRHFIDIAHANAARLLVLTDTLLDLSRLDAGRMEADLHLENLCALIERTAEPFRWLAEQRGLTLTLSLPDPPLSVRCDATMIGKIVGNLLANALKFTRQGRIDVTVTQNSDPAQTPPHTGQEYEQVFIRVSDTGPGIPAEELPHLFERYRQASTAARSAISGSGLGLSLARELASLHGGNIEVDSKVGSGSTFTLWLPGELVSVEAASRIAEIPTGSLSALAAAAVPGLAESVASTGTEDGSRRSTIVAVDDNQNLLNFLREVLESTYHVETATNAIDAMALIRTVRPDLVLSDVMMPGPDGVALCKTIKLDSTLRHTPVILLTARAATQSKVDSLQAGADDYITKPFHPDELRARIGAVLRVREMEAELLQSHEQLETAYRELKGAQQQLIQIEKMAALGTLVAGVAHEINNPVSFIRASIDLMSESIEQIRGVLETEQPAGSPEEAARQKLKDEIDTDHRLELLQQNAAICREGAERATRIVTDLRTFCRPSGGRRDPTDLHETLERSLRLVHGEYRGRITVRREYGTLPLVACDEGQLGQVFVNLLANAAQAIDGQGEIYLRTALQGDLVRIEIEDTGHGMDQYTAVRVFDPFFTTKPTGKGTGLGLSIVHSLVTEHNGTISVSSQPGRGTAFTILLPLGTSHHNTDESDHSGKSAGTSAR